MSVHLYILMKEHVRFYQYCMYDYLKPLSVGSSEIALEVPLSQIHITYQSCRVISCTHSIVCQQHMSHKVCEHTVGASHTHTLRCTCIQHSSDLQLAEFLFYLLKHCDFVLCLCDYKCSVLL